MISFGFTLHWSRFLNQSISVVMQNKTNAITFDSHAKTALKYLQVI